MKSDYLINRRVKNWVAVTISVVLLVLVSSCEKTGSQSYNPPADHTISMGGVLHKSGLLDPLTNCVSCHGSDLKGGTTGVSCYECHNQKW